MALHRYSNSVVDTLPNEADSAISMMQMTEKPDTSYADIGGLDIQKQEIREAVELPLTCTHFQRTPAWAYFACAANCKSGLVAN